MATLRDSSVGHFGLHRVWARMDNLPDATYHAKDSTRNARAVGAHLAWLAWVLVDIGSIGEWIRGESLRGAEGDQVQYERDQIITFDDFSTEPNEFDKKDAELLENEVEEKEVVMASSPTRPPPPSASTSLPLPQGKGCGLAWQAVPRTHRAGHGEPPLSWGLPPKPANRVRFVVDERASAAVERPLELLSAAEWLPKRSEEDSHYLHKLGTTRSTTRRDQQGGRSFVFHPAKRPRYPTFVGGRKNRYALVAAARIAA